MKQTAVVIIDTGFSADSLKTAGQIVAVMDLSSGFSAIGEPFLNNDELDRFCGDPLNHGSLVLKVLMEIRPETPVVLIRAYSDQVRLIRTGFSGGEISSFGWTDAYLWAVNLLNERGYNSVTNCSFGAYTHAMDGTGWEAHSLRRAIGAGKPGHIVVAGAGSGNGKPIHASCSLQEAGHSSAIRATQETDATYNFWAESDNHWKLEVFLNGALVQVHDSKFIPVNFWNDKRQSTFTVYGKGEVVFLVSTVSGGNRFDCWINHQDSAQFESHSDPFLIAEPAVFPEVVAVGLQEGKYASNQSEPDAKPEVLLDGSGPVSFRLPEVVATVADWLDQDDQLDSEAVKARLLSR